MHTRWGGGERYFAMQGDKPGYYIAQDRNKPGLQMIINIIQALAMFYSTTVDFNV